MSYRTYRSSGYGYECPTELTEVLRRVIPGIDIPGMVLYVPYRTQLRIFECTAAPNSMSDGPMGHEFGCGDERLRD